MSTGSVLENEMKELTSGDEVDERREEMEKRREEMGKKRNGVPVITV